jgi:opacity protein-like surface antigen
MIIRSTFVLLLVCGAAVSAFAQDGGARISGFYAGAIGEGATNRAAGGAAGYRFNSRFGFDFEALALPDFSIGEGDTTRDGRGVGFLSTFVAEFPSPASWLTPYVQGGGGVANLRYSSNFFYEDGNGRPIPVEPRGRRIGGRRIDPRTLGDDVRLVRVDGGRSDTSLALSVGGGVDFTLWKSLAVGPNITFMKLFGDSGDIDLTRIGARASYRF